MYDILVNIYLPTLAGQRVLVLCVKPRKQTYKMYLPHFVISPS